MRISNPTNWFILKRLKSINFCWCSSSSRYQKRLFVATRRPPRLNLGRPSPKGARRPISTPRETHQIMTFPTDRRLTWPFRRLGRSGGAPAHIATARYNARPCIPAFPTAGTETRRKRRTPPPSPPPPPGVSNERRACSNAVWTIDHAVAVFTRNEIRADNRRAAAVRDFSGNIEATRSAFPFAESGIAADFESNSKFLRKFDVNWKSTQIQVFFLYTRTWSYIFQF